MVDQFCIELVSNASLSLYENNSLSSFVNFLPDQIDLEGKWQVALVEISCPVKYNNVNEGSFSFKDPKTLEEHTFTVPPGFYTSAVSVADKIMEKVSSLRVSEGPPNKLEDYYLSIKVDYVTEKSTISFPADDSEEAQLSFLSEDLSNILGFEPKSKVTSDKVPLESELPVDIERFHTIMVCCDLVEHSVVGDAKVPILRSFPIINRFRNGHLDVGQTMNNITFQEPLQFHTLSKNSFHSVQIQLRTPTGELMPFSGIGLTRLTLLFQKLH